MTTATRRNPRDRKRYFRRQTARSAAEQAAIRESWGVVTVSATRIRRTVTVAVGAAALLVLAGCSGVVTNKSHDPADTACPYVLHLQDRESGTRSQVCVSEQEYGDTPIGTQWGEESR